MTPDEARLVRLLKEAPKSERHLHTLLREGLKWPFPEGIQIDDVYLDWEPTELHLDPEKVASLRRIRQVAPLTTGQTTGVFILEFDKGHLPIGAIRRVVNQLVRKKRATANADDHPTWALHDLIFFCRSNQNLQVLHVVAFREDAGKRVLRVLRWDEDVTPVRLNHLLLRAVPELSWKRVGPAISVDPGVFAGYREGIRTAAALSKRMAEVAQGVRDEVRSLYEVETDEGPIRKLYAEVRQHLLADLTPERFADVYAQTMVYGLLTARIAHPEQFRADQPILAMRFENQFLDAIYARFRDESDDVIDVDELGLSELAEELAATDVDAVLAEFGAENHRDDPVVYFYETFLSDYDPTQRLALGAFYTPLPVVRYIVNAVDDALKSFDLPDGVADATTWGEYVAEHPEVAVPPGCEPDAPVVAMLEPAVGTGTFLVEWLRRGKANGAEEGLGAALTHASALEISLASYAVSHLKVSLELPDSLRERARLPIYLADTLAPQRPQVFDELADPVSIEGSKAEDVKFGKVHNVVIGNPPYDRVASSGTGGLVVEPGRGGRSLFDDILDDARERVIFSYHASLYNLYVYFWRLAIWQALERNAGPAVVSMITASSWLTGPGFLGLRRLVRELADEVYVLDLGGDNHGARTDENVFDIETPVAIVTLVRRGTADRTTPAHVHYSRVWGGRANKFAALTSFSAGEAPAWEDGPRDWFSPLVPATGGEEWQGFPRLVDLFPLQQPGMMVNRTWPVAPDPETLKRRWEAFVATKDPVERARYFVTPPTGRRITTRVPGMETLANLEFGAEHQPIVRTGMRSFDRQWILRDPRLIALERPALWGALSDQQVFMTSMTTAKLGRGPAATVTTSVPDKHHFRGSFGGKDVIPLYRTAGGTPNADPSLLAHLTSQHRETDPEAELVTVERLFSYVFGVLAGTDYTDRFRDELETPGPRIPLTADPVLFAAMVKHGDHLLWLQTFGERLADGRGEIPLGGIAWQPEPKALPADRSGLGYLAAAETIQVADGLLTGVPKDVWEFEVSGMQVIPKWLGYRMAKPAGRAASSDSPLDKIRPNEWLPAWSKELIEIVGAIRETLALLPAGVEIFEEILVGPLIGADELPPVPATLRQPPGARGSADGLFELAEESE